MPQGSGGKVGAGASSSLWMKVAKLLRRKYLAPEPQETITGYGRLYPSGSNELLAEVTYIIHMRYTPGPGSEGWWGVLRPLRAYAAYELVLHENAEVRLEFSTGQAGEITVTSFPPEPSAEGPVFFQGRGPFS